MPAPASPELEFAALSDTGLLREQNEDRVAVSAEYGLAVLADGMGGYSAGEVASGIAVDVIRQTIENRLRRRWHRLPRASAMQQLLGGAIELANSAILNTARRRPEYAGMGTTIVAALFHHERVVIAHAGDSRAYRLRDGAILQLTRDHSLLQEQLDAGLISPEEARIAEHKNLVTRAVGIDPALEVELHEHRIAAGDLYLLCSDGLSDLLPEPEIVELALAAGSNLQQAAAALVQRANDYGGRDNISVILARVCSGPTAPTRAGLLGRLAERIR
ncbi:MAG: Stp1/IreP family PP2C-type Ser/Thr phosphatase [Burkholderiaceae bacterium]